MRPSAASVCGLKLLVYAASATSVCGLHLAVFDHLVSLDLERMLLLHTSAYVSIRQHKSGHVSIREHTEAEEKHLRLNGGALSICVHT